MNKEEFIKEVQKLGININDEQMKKLEQYYLLLCEWNTKINLTRIIEEKDVYLKHFYDSITLFKAIDLRQKLSICDIGTGAGFPGMVLKIMFPTLQVTLVDALMKRINFLNLVIEKLDLRGIETYHSRAEDYAKNHREMFDIVTSRAVGDLKLLSELSIPMVKVDGYFIPMKGKADEEIKNAESILKKLDSEIIEILEFNLPIENSCRSLIKIKKSKKTNVKYPRNFDKIKKNR